MVVYKATNLVNGKVYIGQTIGRLNRRITGHKVAIQNNKYHYAFVNALRKYGLDGFNWQVICICPNIDSLNEQEEYYIIYYNTMDRGIGYNMQSGGANNLLSDDTKDKIRQKALGRKTSKKTKEKLSKYHTGMVMNISDEWRNQLRDKWGGKNNPMYNSHRTGIDNPFYGKTHSDKTKKDLSNKIKMLWQDPVYRAKQMRYRKKLKELR